MIPFSQFCLAMKVAATGPVSQEDATAALQRYKRLEDGAPSMGQVGRYAGIGAVAAPIAAGLKDVIRGGKGADWKGRTGARNVIGTAVAGALTSGGIPLVRAHLDREAEKNTLRKYVAQGVAPKIASVPAASGVARVKEIFTGSRAKSLRDQAGVATGRADQHFRDATRGHTRFMDYHLASTAKHRDAATRLNIEANVERAKQVGAIGGTAAAATGAVIGAKKLLGRKGTEKEKTSAMSGVTPAKPWAAGEYADMGKMASARQILSAKATGLRRVGQVFSGSRVKALTEDSAAAVRKGSDAFKESERKGTRANELIRWAEEMEPLTMEPQRHARANARLYREEAQRHAAEGAEHVARGAALKREAKGERLKQVGAIGGTAAAAATGAAIGAKKLLSRKDTEKEKTSAMSGVTPAKPWAANEYADMGKMGAGASTRGGFLMASEVAPWRQPKLHTAIQHEPQQIVEKMGAARAEWLQKRAGATTPAGRLASSHRVGLPKVSAPPGPSIADTVPTFGQRLPGANKTTIGKRSIRETPTLANTAPPQG